MSTGKPNLKSLVAASASAPRPPSVEAIFQKSRTFLIATILISMTSIGITLLACFVAAYYMTMAEDLPYRLAAAVFLKLAAGASAVGFVALFALLSALRPIFRGLLIRALKSEETAP
jgi:hypothetical protein